MAFPGSRDGHAQDFKLVLELGHGNNGKWELVALLLALKYIRDSHFQLINQIKRPAPWVHISESIRQLISWNMRALISIMKLVALCLQLVRACNSDAGGGPLSKEDKMKFVSSYSAIGALPNWKFTSSSSPSQSFCLPLYFFREHCN